MTRLGDQLRAERERRGAALEQVSDATKIRTTYLAALEHHDWAALPADVFTRGYLRTYAQYLGLNEEHLLNAYARERRIAGADRSTTTPGRDEPDAARAFLEKLAETRGVKVRRSGTSLRWIVLGLGGIAVASLVVWASLEVVERVRGESTVPPRAEPSPAVVAPAPVAEQAAPKNPEPPAPAVPPSAGHLEVREFGVGTGVVNHRLVGRGDRFREGTVVWFWTSVLNGRRGDKIQHVWMHEGKSIAVAELDVKAAHWRTQSRRRLPEGSTGEWTVEARDPEGRVIATAAFTCVAAE